MTRRELIIFWLLITIYMVYLVTMFVLILLDKP